MVLSHITVSRLLLWTVQSLLWTLNGIVYDFSIIIIIIIIIIVVVVIIIVIILIITFMRGIYNYIPEKTVF